MTRSASHTANATSEAIEIVAEPTVSQRANAA
jgi:hypothetical protein